MKEPGTELSHFVARCLTVPWEFSDRIQARSLWFYDYSSNKIARKSSKSLLARRGLFSPKIEDFLEKYIETPISQCRRELISSDGGTISNWKVFRAFRLMLPFQSYRAYTSLADWTDSTLDQLVNGSEKEIDNFVKRMDREDSLVKVIVPGEYIHVPESGMFAVPILDSKGNKELAFAFPLTPHSLILNCSRKIGLENLSETSFSRFSMGVTNYTQKVIFSPEILSNYTPQDICNEFKTEREIAREILQKLECKVEQERV